MATYRKILVAIDLSMEAGQVLQAAADIAAENDAKISIVHVADNPVVPYSLWSDYVVPFSEDQIHDALFTKLSTVVNDVGLPPSLICVEFGRSIDVIVEKAEKDQADLIVLGSHGRHGIKMLLGSTANGVLHHAKCDVLAVRVSRS